MTIQPIFTVESIEQRCKNDINTFLENNNIKNTTGLAFISDINSKPNMVIQMNKIMTFINPTFINPTFIDNPTNYTTYVKMFHNPIDKERQQQLFIARTILFYQLLQYLVVTFENEKLYNETYTDKDEDEWKFRDDISKSMRDFKMGIFGSMKPTSDIDLGIQYTGDYTKCKPALSYFVSRFEKLFLIFTNQTSLDFDIETYADMTTIPNQNIEEKEHPDVFYLSTSGIDEYQYNRIVKCAKYSIARNYLLAIKELGKKQNNNLTLENIRDSLTGIVAVNQLNTLFNMNDSFEDEISYMNTFFNMPYEQKINEYYKRVSDAEDTKASHGEIIYHLNPEQITEMIVKIGLANTYRIESYCCIPTITHVVRILQQQSQSNLKYPTLAPSSIEDMCSKNHDITHIPICTIGSYGYMLSLLEQLGYLYRFYLTYCETNDENNCNNKMKKYSERYINALIHMNVNKKGGSSRSIRRRTARHGTARHGTARHGTARRGTARHGSVARRSIRRAKKENKIIKRRRTTKRIKMTTKGLRRKSSRHHQK